MNWFRTRLQDGAYTIGLFLIALSLLIFCLPWLVNSHDGLSGWVFANFSIAALYFMGIFIAGRLGKGREGLPLMFNFLILFLISAYALNREMNVFEESVPWMAGMLIATSVNYLVFSFREKLPVQLLTIMYFILGCGFVLFLYLAFYLVPLYGVSIAGFWLLGMSLHTFVPLLFCIYTIVLLRKTSRGIRAFQVSFGAGIAVVVMITTVFTVRWTSIVREINEHYQQGIVQNSSELPAWVYVAGSVPRGSITEKALQGDLVYNLPSGNGFSFWKMPQRDFGEQRKHDPLVMVASLFSGTVKFTEDERIKILESMYDSRHLTLERLWEGKDLVTEDIHTSVQVWPALHMAYTEKLVTVTSHAARSNWPGQQEAIYTFHLPEGSVVSALSLWINGMEHKAVVTTKDKAQKAYNQIVGVEVHDPSVVHWQEGNTVSVRVFPVMNGQSRTFKLGVTTPLTKQGDSLVYQNVYFDGPEASSASETVRMEFKNHPHNLDSDASFTSEGRDDYTFNGSYNPSWSVRFKDEGITHDAFTFDGTTYSAQPYQVQRTGVVFAAAYLDVNASWSREEFDAVWGAVKAGPVYVYDKVLIRVTEENRDRLYEKLHRWQFSLFPFYRITDPAASVFVSKSAGPSPNFQDLQSTPFLNNTKTLMQHHTQVNLFNLGATLSPYLQSLKELRAFRYEQGTPAQLAALIAGHRFAASQETADKVVLEHAGLCLTASPETAPSLAPDHLMRLFTYNHLMQEAGAALFADPEFTTGLSDTAAKAGIVTPVSSMVVLETQEDYDRFGISKSNNSLNNASLHSKGAVPEPHEWALILLALLAMGYAGFSSLQKKKIPA